VFLRTGFLQRSSANDRSNITTSTPGNYHVTGTDNNGCKANAYVQVNSLLLPGGVSVCLKVHRATMQVIS
jgi:hypothetical protein